jgi:alpha-tubulin suppressor-like RCC1 family protein
MRASFVVVGPLVVPFLVPACLLLLACSASPSQTSGGSPGAAEGGLGDAAHTGAPSDGGSAGDAPGATSLDGAGETGPSDDAGDGGALNSWGLTKVLTGEYATHLLVKGTLYTLSATSYQGVPGASLPPVPIDVPAGTTFIDGQSGLHQSLGVDSTGHVWMWGDNPSGDAGIDGTGSGVLPYRVAHDASGNDFADVVSVAAGDEVDGAVKSDGTVWVWGTCTGGLAGDGNAALESIVYPTQVPIPFPSGVKATKLLLGNIGLVLASDGSVWAWGGGGTPGAVGMGNTAGYASAQKLATLPANVVDITVGGNFAYALTGDGELYGWGYFGLNLGLGTWQASNPSCYEPTLTPTLLTSAPAGQTPALPLPAKVSKVVADAITTHVILTDGSLWGWGDDAQGEVGDGQQLDWWSTTEPFAWDWGQCELPVVKPVQIAKDVTSPWVVMWSNSPAVFYTFAMTADGTLYSWGRNKTGNLGNGVVAPNTHQAAQYPDSWNVLVPTAVLPLSLKQVTPVGSPYCTKFGDAGDCLCPNGTPQGC